MPYTRNAREFEFFIFIVVLFFYFIFLSILFFSFAIPTIERSVSLYSSPTLTYQSLSRSAPSIVSVEFILSALALSRVSRSLQRRNFPFAGLVFSLSPARLCASRVAILRVFIDPAPTHPPRFSRHFFPLATLHVAARRPSRGWADGAGAAAPACLSSATSDRCTIFPDLIKKKFYGNKNYKNCENSRNVFLAIASSTIGIPSSPRLPVVPATVR